METEITVEVLEDIKDAKKKIIDNGYVFAGSIDYCDKYYSRYPIEVLQKFNYAELIKNSFLVRQILENDNVITYIVYKDKVVDDTGNVVSENKVSCVVESMDKITEVLKMAGIECYCEVKQHMSIFNNGKTSFALQEVENLGNFIEYEEDDDMSELTEYEKINILTNRIKSIGLNLGNDFSCKKVYMKFQKNN